MTFTYYFDLKYVHPVHNSNVSNIAEKYSAIENHLLFDAHTLHLFEYRKRGCSIVSVPNSSEGYRIWVMMQRIFHHNRIILVVIVTKNRQLYVFVWLAHRD